MGSSSAPLKALGCRPRGARAIPGVPVGRPRGSCPGVSSRGAVPGLPVGRPRWRAVARVKNSEEEALAAASAETSEADAAAADETKGSDLWSFIGADEATDEEMTGSLVSLDEEDEEIGDYLLSMVSEDLRNELQLARDEKEELEVVRLQLESKAQDLAESSVEAREESDAAAEALTGVRARIADASEEEVRLLEILEATRASLATLQEAQEEAQAEGPLAVDEVDWMDDRTTPPGDESGMRSGEDAVELDALTAEVAKATDAFAACQAGRAAMEAEVSTLEERASALEAAAGRMDSLAAGAMAEVELAVAAEMAAQARMEDFEHKIEDALKEIKKEMEKMPPPSTKQRRAGEEEEMEEREERETEIERDSPTAAAAAAAAAAKDEESGGATSLSASAEDGMGSEGDTKGGMGGAAASDAATTDDAPAQTPAIDAATTTVPETPPTPSPVGDPAPSSLSAKKAEGEEGGKKAGKKSSKSSKHFSASYFSSAESKMPWPDLREATVDLVGKLQRVVAIMAALAAAWVAASVGINRGRFQVVTPQHAVQYVTTKVKGMREPVATATKELLAPAKSQSPAKKEKPGKGRAEEALDGAHAAEDASAESGLTDTLWLLATSVVVVPLISKLPGGSPVLGFLLGGALIGPNALGFINNIDAVHHIAELGVIFLLFNIGLELSFERLQAMQKYVFGLGTCQVVFTMLAAAALAAKFIGLNGAGATIIGAAMALSSTAVALQVLQDRGEASSRHGRAAFSILLLQDLAVVVFLMLVPLLETSGTGGLSPKQFCISIGQAVVKAVVAIAMIIAGGRLMFRPIYKRIAKTSNAEIFAATTLLVVLGTSMLTQKFGLSMELGAFIAGLLLAETEYALQVESDIAPYRGLLLGLFFMTVGMNFSATLLISQWRSILATMAILLIGKTAVVGLSGPVFGLSRIAAIRAGLLLAPGGEFAFVLLGEASAKNIVNAALCSRMYLVVALGMALTPLLAHIGHELGTRFENKDVLNLQPTEGEVDDLRGHVIVAGFGRVGQMICQLLSERLIPFVALDVRSDRVAKGREMEMPVYFGDSGSAAVLHSIGANKAACAVVALDTPGSNYRCVWTIKKNYPNVKTYVRARDVAHGLNLEKAGASAVVPETLEPSLQLAAAVLQEMQLPPDEVATTIDGYRRRHMSELSELALLSGSSMGYVTATESN